MKKLLAIVLLSAVLVVATAPPVAANTTVEVHGHDVVLTVTIDCAGCKGKTVTVPDGKGGSQTVDLADHWAKTAQDQWNAAFDKFPYCNKYKLRLKVKVNAKGASFKGAKGHHLIQAGQPGSGLQGTGWEG